MKTDADYHYPGNDTYTQNLYSDEGIKKLTQNSRIIELLEDLERRGNNVSGARDEVNALFNYVTSTRKMKSEVLTHLAYLKQCVEKS